MEFTQTQLANITLGSTVEVGEFEDHITHAKPGNYRVYRVRHEADSEESALLYVHEDEVQDVNKLLPTVDIDTFCGVDGGTFGIATHQDDDENSRDWWERTDENQEGTDGFVTYTTYGDGQFSVYTNKDHSVFLLDDENIYLEALLIDRDVDTHLEWFSFDDEEIEICYLPLQGFELYTLARPIDASRRKIDQIANALADVEQLARVNEVVNELEDEPTQEQ